MKKRDNVKLAIYAAELVLKNYENVYPNDDRPHRAIEAAKKVLKNNTASARDEAKAAEAEAWDKEWYIAIEAELAARPSESEKVDWASAWSVESAKWTAEKAARSAESAKFTAAKYAIAAVALAARASAGSVKVAEEAAKEAIKAAAESAEAAKWSEEAAKWAAEAASESAKWSVEDIVESSAAKKDVAEVAWLAWLAMLGELYRMQI